MSFAFETEGRKKQDLQFDFVLVYSVTNAVFYDETKSDRVKASLDVPNVKYLMMFVKKWVIKELFNCTVSYLNKIDKFLFWCL